jgi:glutaconate CoA-transferase subunit A
MVATEKKMSIEDAVEKFIPDGAHVGLGGFTTQRHPMALIREIIRRRKKNLTIYGHSPGIDADMLIGTGCVKRAEVAYIADELIATPGPAFRIAVEQKKIQWEDYSNYGATLRFVAGAMGLGFLPTKSMLGTDIEYKWGFGEKERSKERKNDPKVAPKKLSKMECPFTKSPHLLVPAVQPDVGIIHVQYVGDEGTVRIIGQEFADKWIAMASDRLIATCEEIVPENEIRRNPQLNQLPSYKVDAIIEVPFGAHPTACFNFYDYDIEIYIEWVNSVKEGKIDEYVEKYITSVDDHFEYLEKIGGVAKLFNLKHRHWIFNYL